MWKTVLATSMQGPIDYEKVRTLRRSLNLQPRGRWDDDDDEAFGERYLVDSGEDRARLTLWRGRADEWMVTLLATPAAVPSRDNLTQLLAEIRTAAQSVGLTIQRENIWPT
ncbi:hypothetical protein [Frankia sp. QA3]|uniref:hypothetical protein n=1 Tax=Frankia sp. QA3 TaxID=710111 RepID=UPI000269C0A1|nr:hypothetical protein [Frankia sp. QA3]EIV92767.1 hypothetical protein FraQA3DRAFT_2396 [Frankia sp. QA3]